DVRIAEYSGVDPLNPVDTSASAQGSGTETDSGVATTTNAIDLLVAANVVQTAVTGEGTGFTKRLITSRGAAAPVLYVYDTFADVDGTPLASHTPDTGGVWIDDQPGIKAVNGLFETEAEGVTYGEARSHNNATPSSPDYEVSAEVRVNFLTGNRAGVRGRDA